jgi:hypothetical protein
MTSSQVFFATSAINNYSTPSLSGTINNGGLVCQLEWTATSSGR